MHLADLLRDIRVGRIPAHVLDHRLPTRAQDPVHLGQSASRTGEVLERGLADDKVERLRVERQAGCVAVLEVGADPGLYGIFGCDLDE